VAGSEVAGSVVALGKFEGLHVGHRALAERAAEMGTPFLLSFSGMAEVLGWEPQYVLETFLFFNSYLLDLPP
jgi:FAD synthase